MFQKMGVLLLSGAVAASLALPAAAAEETGTIQVTVDSGLTDVFTRKLVLYRVGEKIEEGYRITDEFGGGLVFPEDAFSPHLARMLSETDGSAGAFRMVDSDNTAEFSAVEPGLYLLKEEGEDPVILPCMTAMPREGRWQVQAYPVVKYVSVENPRTGQHPAPVLGALGMVLSGIGLAVCAGVRGKK